MNTRVLNAAALALAMTPAAAGELLKYFLSPDVARVMRAIGLEPAG